MINQKPSQKHETPFSCYTDASFCNQSQSKIGVIYIMIYIGQQLKVQQHFQYNNKKNSQLQKLGIQLCIEKCKQLDASRSIIVYTDCQSALQKQYGGNVQLVWVKGHSKKSQKSEIDLKFQICDKKSRKIMRDIAKNQQNQK